MNRKSTRRLLVILLLTLIKNIAYATPPVITNLNGDISTFTVAGAAVSLDAGTNATITTATAPDFNNAVLTVAIITGLNYAEDVLIIKNAGQLNASGGKLTYAGNIIGKFS